MRKPTVLRDDVLARLFQWLDTQEGMLSMRAFDNVAVALEGVGLDIEKRRIVWPDGKRLTIDQTVKRIQNKTTIDFHIIESHVICWLKMRCEPKGLDEKQMECLEVKINRWIEDHRREKGKLRLETPTQQAR